MTGIRSNKPNINKTNNKTTSTPARQPQAKASTLERSPEGGDKVEKKNNQTTTKPKENIAQKARNFFKEKISEPISRTVESFKESITPKDENIGTEYYDMADNVIKRVNGNNEKDAIAIEDSPKIFEALEWDAKNYDELKPHQRELVDSVNQFKDDKISQRELAKMLYEADKSYSEEGDAVIHGYELGALENKAAQSYLEKELETLRQSGDDGDDIKTTDAILDQAKRNLQSQGYSVLQEDGSITNALKTEYETNDQLGETMEVYYQNKDVLGEETGREVFFSSLGEDGKIGIAERNSVNSDAWTYTTANAQKTESTEAMDSYRVSQSMDLFSTSHKNPSLSKKILDNISTNSDKQQIINVNNIKEEDIIKDPAFIAEPLERINDKILTDERVKDFISNTDLDDYDAVKEKIETLANDVLKEFEIERHVNVAMRKCEDDLAGAEAGWSEDQNGDGEWDHTLNFDYESLIESRDNMVSLGTDPQKANENVLHYALSSVIHEATHNKQHDLIWGEEIDPTDQYKGNEQKSLEQLASDDQSYLNITPSMTLFGSGYFYATMPLEAQARHAEEVTNEKIDKIMDW